METEPKKVDLGSTREIELPKIDVTKYVGRKAKIEKTEEYEGKYGYFVKVETEILDPTEEAKGIELRGSRIFGLFKDSKGTVGWASNTMLGQFLAKMKAPHYRQLKGKQVIIQIKSKDGTDYLTFA